MEAYTKNGCRGKGFSSTDSTKLSFTFLFKLDLSTIMTLALLPALFSCSAPAPLSAEQITGLDIICTKGSADVGNMDIFTFNDDRLMLLDSYQHIDGSKASVDIRSQNGDKIVFACINGQREKYDWTVINSFPSMKEIEVDLRKERRSSPCMTGSTVITAGKEGAYRLELRRIASEIILRSIRCDFTNKSYKGKGIDEVKVYLTNVNSRCSITSDGAVTPTEIINAGGLVYEDLEGFPEPDMVLQTIERSIGRTVLMPDIRLSCYPSAGTSDSPGTPYTRLVIEGKIDGTTYWWPIDINRDGNNEEQGIYRNRQYIFDVIIKRKGTSDPDTVIEIEDAEIIMNIQPWKEKEDHTIGF